MEFAYLSVYAATLILVFLVFDLLLAGGFDESLLGNWRERWRHKKALAHRHKTGCACKLYYRHVLEYGRRKRGKPIVRCDHRKAKEKERLIEEAMTAANS